METQNLATPSTIFRIKGGYQSITFLLPVWLRKNNIQENKWISHHKIDLILKIKGYILKLNADFFKINISQFNKILPFRVLGQEINGLKFIQHEEFWWKMALYSLNESFALCKYLLRKKSKLDFHRNVLNDFWDPLLFLEGSLLRSNITFDWFLPSFVKNLRLGKKLFSEINFLMIVL